MSKRHQDNKCCVCNVLPPEDSTFLRVLAIPHKHNSEWLYRFCSAHCMDMYYLNPLAYESTPSCIRPSWYKERESRWPKGYSQIDY